MGLIWRAIKNHGRVLSREVLSSNSGHSVTRTAEDRGLGLGNRQERLQGSSGRGLKVSGPAPVEKLRLSGAYRGEEEMRTET